MYWASFHLSPQVGNYTYFPLSNQHLLFLNKYGHPVKWGFPFSIVSDVADVPGANMQLPCGKRRWHRVGLFQLSLLIERKIWLSFLLSINLSISLAPECDEWWVNNGVNDWIAMENIWARMIKRNHHVTRYNPNKRSNSAQLLYRLIADRSADGHKSLCLTRRTRWTMMDD